MHARLAVQYYDISPDGFCKIHKHNAKELAKSRAQAEQQSSCGWLSSSADDLAEGTMYL
jgi:hypothetical protein